MSAYVGSSKNLKDLKDLKYGLSTEQVPVSAYARSSKNLKDLKDPKEAGLCCGSRLRKGEVFA